MNEPNYATAMAAASHAIAWSMAQIEFLLGVTLDAPIELERVMYELGVFMTAVMSGAANELDFYGGVE